MRIIATECKLDNFESSEIIKTTNKPRRAGCCLFAVCCCFRLCRHDGETVKSIVVFSIAFFCCFWLWLLLCFNTHQSRIGVKQAQKLTLADEMKNTTKSYRKPTHKSSFSLYALSYAIIVTFNMSIISILSRHNISNAFDSHTTMTIRRAEGLSKNISSLSFIGKLAESLKGIDDDENHQIKIKNVSIPKQGCPEPARLLIQIWQIYYLHKWLLI